MQNPRESSAAVPATWPTGPLRRSLLRLTKGRRILLVASLAALVGVLALNLAPARAEDAPPAATPLCSAQGTVPPAECEALVALFKSSGGPGWSNRSGWLTPSAQAPCDWFGVACTGGHVTSLSLPTNNLDGSLPLAIGNLPALKTLKLNDNKLGGFAPRSLCLLSDTVTQADFSFNRLRARSTQVEACLTALDADWKAAQTTPPTDLRAAAITSTTVTLNWTPLSHLNAGSTLVSRSETPAGPWTLVTTLPSLATGAATISGLDSGRAYWLRIQSAVPAAGDQSFNLLSDPALLPVVTASTQKVLVAVYFAADNDLTAHAPIVLERLRTGSAANPTAEIVYLVDEAGPGNTTLYRIANGVVTPTTLVAQRFGEAEIDSADPDALAWFLQTARAAVPGAANEIVSILGHGVGLMPEYTLSDPFAMPFTAGADALPTSAIVPLPREKEATPTDFTSGNFLSTHDLADALAAATAGGSTPFDLIFLDQCFGGSLDLLYEMRSAATQFVASPNYAWLSAPYERYLPTFAPLSSPEQIGRAIIGIYQLSLDDSHPNAIVSISSAEVTGAMQKLSALGDALITGLAKPGAVNQLVPAIASATMQSRFADTALCGDEGFALEPPDEQVGVIRFATVLSNTLPLDSLGAQGAAASLATHFTTVERTWRTGSPYLAPDEVWLYDDALTILAPLLRGSPSDAVWRSTIYRAGAPFAATYAPAPNLSLTIDRSFASTIDFKWDEFLDAWYTAEQEPTVGQWCRYTPAALVLSESASTVPLAITQPFPGKLTFAWAPAQGVQSWQIFARLPGRRGFLKGWTLLATLPNGLASSGSSATQITYTVDAMPAGEFGARIAGFSAEGLVIAYSEIAAFTVDVRILLPVVRSAP